MSLREIYPDAYHRLGCDDELLQQLAVIYVADTPELRTKLANQIEEQQFAMAAETAHAVKGLVITFDDGISGHTLQELVDALKAKDFSEIDRLWPQCQAIIDGICDNCSEHVGNS